MNSFAPRRRGLAAIQGTVLAMTMMAMIGCGQPAGPTLVEDDAVDSHRPAAAPDSAPPELDMMTSTVSKDELPELADPLPPLDDGRVEVAGPEGWHVPPRDPRWLARFQLVASNAYPVILVHLPESHEGTDEVAADNAAAFAANVASHLRRELESQGLSVPAVEPLVIGDFAGAMYVRQATIKGKNLRLERLYLVTVRGGRRYTIEMQAVFGTLNEFRDYAIAVAEGMTVIRPDRSS